MLVQMLKSVAYAAPILDASGKRQLRNVTINGVDQKVAATENVYCFANHAYDVPDDVAQDWIANGYARDADPDFDDLGPAPGADAPKGNTGSSDSGNA